MGDTAAVRSVRQDVRVGGTVACEGCGRNRAASCALHQRKGVHLQYSLWPPHSDLPPAGRPER